MGDPRGPVERATVDPKRAVWGCQTAETTTLERPFEREFESVDVLRAGVRSVSLRVPATRFDQNARCEQLGCTDSGWIPQAAQLKKVRRMFDAQHLIDLIIMGWLSNVPLAIGSIWTLSIFGERWWK